MKLHAIRALIRKPKCSKCGNYQRKKGTCYEPCQYPESRMTELEDVAEKLLAVAEAANAIPASVGEEGQHGDLARALAALEADT